MPQSHYKYSSPESPIDYYEPLYTPDTSSYKSRFEPRPTYPTACGIAPEDRPYYNPTNHHSARASHSPASPTGYYARPRSSHYAPSPRRTSKECSVPPAPPLEEDYYSTSPSSSSSRRSRHTDNLFDYNSDDDSSYGYDKEKLSQRFDRNLPGRRNASPPYVPKAPSHRSSSRSTTSSSSRRVYRSGDDGSTTSSSININGNDIEVDSRGVRINGKRHELPGGKGMFTVGGVRIIIKEDGTIRVG